MSFHEPKHCCSNHRVVGLEFMPIPVRKRLEAPFHHSADGLIHALDACQVIICKGHADHTVLWGVVPDSLAQQAAQRIMRLKFSDQRVDVAAMQATADIIQQERQ